MFYISALLGRRGVTSPHPRRSLTLTRAAKLIDYDTERN